MAETRVLFNAPAISCNHCKMAIEKAVSALDGVREVVVDVGDKAATVAFDDEAVTLEEIEATMADEGYEVAGRHVFGA